MAALASSNYSEAVSLVTNDYQTLEPQLKRIMIASLGVSSNQEALDFLLKILEATTDPEMTWALEALSPKLFDENLKKRVGEIISTRKNASARTLLRASKEQQKS